MEKQPRARLLGIKQSLHSTDSSIKTFEVEKGSMKNDGCILFVRMRETQIWETQIQIMKPGFSLGHNVINKNSVLAVTIAK